ncbi:hypothetical protein PTTG_00012 [Puccinia triticina 1-1 BBBD Race 1]|uniref:Uncharacterized protein n=1 Tax=Puccinia triticina (isolate 1-1 / race 1 (BBBD)) TaxID=630390 RepID=A0A0C4EGZ6_PUCT1|nr:hypothetical protein PTTG_00012 [Puccinia triticina 1-1 BBBD Race 1]
MKEASDHVKRLAQANPEDTPDLDKPLIQQEIAKTLTLKPQKPKKSKTVTTTNRATRSSSKAPTESRPLTGQSTPKEGPLATCEEGQSSGSNALESLCRDLIGDPRGDRTTANPVNADLAGQPTTTGGPSTEEDIRIKIAKLTDHAFAAEEAGNTTLAKRYFTICEGLSKPKPQPVTNAPPISPAPPALPKAGAVAVMGLNSTEGKTLAGGADTTPGHYQDG